MTKRELVVRISEESQEESHVGGLTQQQVFYVVQKTLDYVTDSLVKGETVEFRDFGVFEVKVRKPRIGRNPNKPENTVTIPERRVVKFKAGKEMRAKVLKS
jgi:nucleoid DNA-binding protein